LWVFREFAAGNDLAGLFYALGGSLGTFLSVKKTPSNDSPRIIKNFYTDLE
jgi:hypothetical protein